MLLLLPLLLLSCLRVPERPLQSYLTLLLLLLLRVLCQCYWQLLQLSAA
jgi:hypothetical protein